MRFILEIKKAADHRDSIINEINILGKSGKLKPNHARNVKIKF